MAISHADHDHPNTPAARAACRKAMAATPGVSFKDNAMRTLAEKAGVVKPAKITVAKSPGTKGLREAGAAAKNIKRTNTKIKTIGDLADVPRMLAYGVKLAWAEGWEVRVGDKFNDSEARIVIDAPAGEIALVWRPTLPNGVWGVFFRAGYGSVTVRCESVQAGIALGNNQMPNE